MAAHNRTKRWWILSLGLIALGILFGGLWYVAAPKLHHSINDESFAQIHDGMKRSEVERLLAGPPRAEVNSTKHSVWDGIVPTESWGHTMIPSSFLSPVFEPNLDEATKKQRAADQALFGQKNADAAKDGFYLISWHHDLTTIAIIFDGTSDEVRGGVLWKPREKTWREHPPFRWFR